ncbi:MAG: hypothetical protein K8R54_00055 [Bacteroidales bacterium]|nr:hypothetical protein [Bacteroidales bacterium]
MSKNLLKTVIILIAVAFVTLQSCEKKEFIETENKTENNEILNINENIEVAETFIYNIDDIQVNKEEFDEYTNKYEDPFIIYTGKENEETKEIINVVYAYTTEAGYIKYGEKNNLKLKELLDFETHMREYAEKSGAIAEFERTGKVPESYKKYEEAYYNKVSKGGNKALLVEFSKEHWRQGSHVYMGHMYAVMPLSWDRKVSSLQYIGAAGNASLYKNRFYGRRIGYFPKVGSTVINLYGHADNATRSAIKHW